MSKKHDYYIDAIHIMPLCAIVCLMYLLYTLNLIHGTLFSITNVVSMLISVSYAINKTNFITITVAFIFTVLINAMIILNGY